MFILLLKAFTIAERHLGISVLLDVADMVENIVPDKLSVITYVSQLYQYFKDKTPGMKRILRSLTCSKADYRRDQ